MFPQGTLGTGTSGQTALTAGVTGTTRSSFCNHFSYCDLQLKTKQLVVAHPPLQVQTSAATKLKTRSDRSFF